MQLTTRAHAKVNLHLEVLNKRPDGYHAIFSLMASVGFCDLLKLESVRLTERPDGECSITVHAAGGKYPELIETIPHGRNLIEMAAALYCRTAGLSGEIVFTIEKNIPSGAGLGGGSTDAAAALRLLNQRLGRVSEPDLRALAAQLGADVPFCLNGGAAICEGIGDIIEPLVGRVTRHLVIANDGIYVNTAAAYASLHRGQSYPVDRDALNRKRARIIEDFANGNLRNLTSIRKNDFEAPVFAEHPRIEHINAMMAAHRPEFAAMTGSGSSIIGVFESESDARSAHEALQCEVKHCILTALL
ncbi:MAG TPA: 4-(cytidine 5'-diphospho)-2-C-methyl-D-erythritol kinase [Spirochaetota bacterium]|nr:4-(cytidine 5'-diphospho)-2-C-methyl-D-erythritol kinase [Spirochaetota bacterium]HNT09266.1 4-(cytidine 5'-diphospho)-2-C-methyl-D-erythritol kinase [Spirochaetota bacterium]